MPFRGWLESFSDWRQRLMRELAAVPDTLSQLRDGVENFRRVAERLDDATAPSTLEELRDAVENFRRVTQRLSDATGPMEQYNNLPSMSEVLQRAQDANRRFREQIASMPGGERMAASMEDLSESLAAMGRLIPFWARGLPRDPPGPRKS